MLYKSFGSVDAYRKAVSFWQWKALLYFFLLAALSTLSAVLATQKVLDRFYDTAVSPALEQLSKVKISDGKIKIEGGQNIEMKTADGKIFAVASEKLLEPSQTKNLMFAFEKDRVTFYLPEGEEMFFNLGEHEKILEGKSVNALFPPKNILILVIMPLTCFFLFVLPMNTMFLAMLSLAAYILSRTIFPVLSFAECVKLALVALTPSIIIDIILVLVFGFPTQGFVYALISGGMVYYMLRMFAKTANRPE